MGSSPGFPPQSGAFPVKGVGPDRSPFWPRLPGVLNNVLVGEGLEALTLRRRRLGVFHRLVNATRRPCNSCPHEAPDRCVTRIRAEPHADADPRSPLRHPSRDSWSGPTGSVSPARPSRSPRPRQDERIGFNSYSDIPVERSMVAIAGLIIVTAVGILLTVFLWINPELQRVRSALRAEEPDIVFSLGSYGGPGGDGLLVTLVNREDKVAHNLAFRVTGMAGVLWRKEFLAPQDRVRVEIVLTNGTSLRATELSNAEAELQFENRFGHKYTATATMTQSVRDRLYNIGPRSAVRVERPQLTRWAMWQLRRDV